MRRVLMRKLGMALAAVTIIAAPLAGAAAQNRNVLNQQGGLVNVNVTNLDLLKNFANNNEVQLLNNVTVPVTVQAPINIAANVCGVAVNVLAQGGPSTNDCTATQGSEALTDLAIAQLTTQQ
jgi:hypothetical protein